MSQYESYNATAETKQMLDLIRFEELALSQQPASQPWTPVTDYSYEGRKAAEGQHPKLILDTFHPIRLLDFGCGPATLLRLLDEEQPTWAHQFAGYEPGDVQRYSVYNKPPLDVEAFDLVICREVLEHCTLIEIRRIVTLLCKLSSRFVYVTTRFSSEHDLLRVETSDNLDPTHVTIASKDLYRLLFVLEGFKRRADLEERMDWQHKNRCLVYERAV